MEQNKPITHLFETIAVYDRASVDVFIENLNMEQASFVITQALQMAQKKGIFTLQESEIISKSLRLLENPPNI